ncbi:hypothetical protein X801_04017, partial [Opisthorchis viverrini]
FLFYEPNFDDPIHHHGDYKDLGKREQLIRLSLVGGTIDDIVFKPNNEWCLWAEDNLLPSTAPTEASPSFVPSVAELTGEAQSQLPSADAPTELQREVSSLSAYYQSNAPIEFDQFSRIDPEFLDLFTEANCLPFYTENAFLCHISLQPKNSSLAICEHTFCGCPTRYYYAEMCSHGYSMYLASWLDDSHGPALSLHILHTETPLQKAEIGIWNPLSREDGELLERLRQLFYGYKKVVEQNNGLVSDEQISESRSVNLSEENNEELETKCVIESESSVCGAGDTRRNNEVQTQVPVHSVDSGITNQLVSEAENVTGLVVFPNVAEQIESTLAAKPDEDDSNPSSPQVTEVEDFVEEPLEVQTAPVPGSDGSQLEDYSHSPDADQNTYDLNNTDHELRTMLYATQCESNRLINRRKGLKLLFSLLRPFWWIFYQTRWPPFLAPGYLFTVNDDFIRYFGSYFYPASACQLAFELYNHRPRAEEPVPLILIDSLALSPFSPVVNRVILLPRDTVNEHHDCGAGFVCTSVEWISPAQTFSTCPHRSGSEHLPGSALLAVLSFLSNWLAYFSRMELQGIVLGYSQYRDTYTVRPMGIACMYPATLGCGQLTLLDAWPLQLLVHSVRACCSTLVYLSSRLSPRSNFMYPRLWFSFTDIDNI